MNKVSTCPCCGNQCEIEDKKDEIEVQDVDSLMHLRRYTHYSYCHGCGSEFANAEQARKNLDEPLRR